MPEGTDNTPSLSGQDAVNVQNNYVNFLKERLKTEKDPVAIKDYNEQLAGATKSLEKYQSKPNAGLGERKPIERQKVQGPDQKWYAFPKTWSQDKINQHFVKQGWVRKDNKWYTQTGEEAKMGTPRAIPVGLGSGVSTGGRSRVTLKEPEAIKKESATTAYMGESLPTIGGAIGGTIGKTPGAALGGAAGEGLRQLYRGIVLGETISDKDRAIAMGVEAVKQGGLQKIGDKAGEVFFNALNKIPHSVIQKGIKFLPSEIKPGGTIYKYVEDLLSNLAPSASTMEEFKSKRDKVILDKVTKLAQGFTKFDGTSEEMGTLVQQALAKGKDAAQDALDRLRLSLPKGKQTAAELAKRFPNEVAEFQQTYENQLVRAIVRTNKPELIAGLLRGSNAALNETRTMTDVLHEIDPVVLGKVRNRIMRDVLSETISGSRDPIAKTTAGFTEKFVGNSFKKTLDKIGEEKLKAIYGETAYKNIENFIKLTGSIGGKGGLGGFGKFMNLAFIAPFRNSIGVKTALKVTGSAFVINRAAKMITSTEGMRMYENYIRAVGSNSPRLVNLAIDEIRKYNQRSDDELVQEEQDARREYEKEKETK